jgi:hypothetical protein
VNVTFAFPLALLLLVAIPVAIWFGRRAGSPLPLPRADVIGGGRSLAAVLAALPDLLRAAALAAIILAIAGPSTAGAVIEESS